jgi:hypothetical protein
MDHNSTKKYVFSCGVKLAGFIEGVNPFFQQNIKQFQKRLFWPPD